MDFRQEKKKSLVLNLTSLIDVLFLLLIFFMVTTTFLSQPAIKLDLPDARNSDTVRQLPIVISVDRAGRVFLNDEPTEVDLLGAALAARLAESTTKAVVLKADTHVTHGAVVRVLDIVKGAGVKKLVVSTADGK